MTIWTENFKICRIVIFGISIYGGCEVLPLSKIHGIFHICHRIALKVLFLDFERLDFFYVRLFPKFPRLNQFFSTESIYLIVSVMLKKLALKKRDQSNKLLTQFYRVRRILLFLFFGVEFDFNLFGNTLFSCE